MKMFTMFRAIKLKMKCLKFNIICNAILQQFVLMLMEGSSQSQSQRRSRSRGHSHSQSHNQSQRQSHSQTRSESHTARGKANAAWPQNLQQETYNKNVKINLFGFGPFLSFILYYFILFLLLSRSHTLSLACSLAHFLFLLCRAAVKFQFLAQRWPAGPATCLFLRVIKQLRFML